MASRFRRGRRSSVWLGLSWALAVIASTGIARGLARREEPDPMGALEWVEVRRVDLATKLLAGGDLQPIKQTTVTCQVEDIADLDGTSILTMIANGAAVKKGDEICRLDSAPLEE